MRLGKLSTDKFCGATEVKNAIFKQIINILYLEHKKVTNLSQKQISLEETLMTLKYSMEYGAYFYVSKSHRISRCNTHKTMS